MEHWHVIHGFEKYSVSDHGRIRNDLTDRILSLNENQYGVVVVGLMREGKQKHRSVPLLVAKSFIEKRFAAYDTPINLDGDRWNNHIDNLDWRPRWFAIQYNRQFRVPFEYPIFQPIRDTDTGEITPTSFETARRYGLLERDVVLSITNNTIVWPTHQKFHIVD